MPDASSQWEERKYLILPPPKPLQITPSRLIQRIRIAQIRRRLKILSSPHRIFVHAPAIPEAIGQFEDGQDELAFGSAAFLDSGLEGFGFYAG